MIEGHGRGDADIMLIGDFPSKEDIVRGQALSGSTERELRAWFSSHDYNINQTYRTSWFKELPEYNGKNRKLRKESLAACEASIAPLTFDEIIGNEIRGIRPNVIVPLGEFSFNKLTGYKGIGKFRGSVLPMREEIQSEYPSHSFRIIPVLGPADLRAPNQVKLKVVSQLDIGKVVANAHFEGPIKEDFIVWIADSAESVRRYFERYEGTENIVVFDIETKHNIPDCIGFCCDGAEAMVVPLLGKKGEFDVALRWFYCAAFLAKPTKKVNQNIKYDIGILERFGMEINNIYGDTSLRAHILYPEFDKNLGFLNSLYTTIPYFKDEGKEFDPRIHDVKRRYTYCGKDCISTYRVYQGQESDLAESNLKPQEAELMNSFHVYRKIERNGILIDMSVNSALKDKYNALYDVYQCEIDRLTMRNINADSPQQVGELIYEELKFPMRKKADTGNWDTSENVLEELYVLHADECNNNNLGPRAIRIILILRKLANILEFLDTPVHFDGRLRGSYKLSGTNTFRTSSSKSNDREFYYEKWDKRNDKPRLALRELGHSLQTISKHGFKVGDKVFGKDIRRQFVPTPGYIFIEADLSQAEARVDAVLAREFEFIELFDKPPGVHCLTGSWAFECRPEEIKKGSIEYHESKIIRHAGERNLQPKLLALMLQRELPFAISVLDRFHKAQPNIRGVFHHDVREAIKTEHSLTSPHGFKRVFFGREDHDTFNEAISYLPQCTVSIQTRRALPEIDEKIKSARILLEAHDGIMSEIRKDDVEQYVKVFTAAVQQKIDFRRCSLPRDYELSIPAEIEWSDTNWAELRKWEG